MVVADESSGLAACLDSLRNQTLTDLEVIIVGGSPEAHRLASRLVVPDERVRLDRAVRRAGGRAQRRSG